MLKALGLKLRLTLERLIASILWAGDLFLPRPMLLALTRVRFNNSDGSCFKPSVTVLGWMGGSNVAIILLVRYEAIVSEIIFLMLSFCLYDLSNCFLESTWDLI